MQLPSHLPIATYQHIYQEPPVEINSVLSLGKFAILEKKYPQDNYVGKVMIKLM